MSLDAYIGTGQFDPESREPKHLAADPGFEYSLSEGLPIPDTAAEMMDPAESGSSNLFELYSAQQHFASRLEDDDPAMVAKIRQGVGEWFNRSGQSELTINSRVRSMTDHLIRNYGSVANRVKIDAASSYTLLEAVQASVGEGNRQEPIPATILAELGHDIKKIMPIIKYLPVEVRRAALRGMPESVTRLASSIYEAEVATPASQSRLAGILGSLSRVGRSSKKAQVEVEPENNTPESRRQFDDYIALRKAAARTEKVDGEELKTMQEDVRAWIASKFSDFDKPGTVEDYRTYSAEVINEKIGSLVEYLRDRYGDKVSEAELMATEAFMDSAFSMYEDREKGEVLNDKGGSFGFIVPARMSRNYPMYGREVEPVIPALRYVPNELRAWIMRGCPPFIIDTYKPGPDGKRGYLIYAPVTEDMRLDLSTASNGPFMGAAQEAVNDAVALAHERLGIEVVGLGATLPAVTYLGKTVRKRFGDKVIVTTGHGGTVELICAAIDANTESPSEKKGVLGLGAIGASTAVILSERYPDSKVIVYDIVDANVKKLQEANGERFTRVASESELIAESDIIVSAIAAKHALDLDALGVGDMKGKKVFDDSQPASMDPRQVWKRGGRYLWIIGQDGKGQAKRSMYGYGTMLNETVDLFGCEGEVYALYSYYRDLQKWRNYTREQAKARVASLAITGPVTAESAGQIGELFKIYGIIPAQPQAFGRAA